MNPLNHNALLVLDMQGPFVANLPAERSFLEPIGRAIAAARAKAIPVIYVVVSFRPGMPEIGSTNQIFSPFKERMHAADMQEFARIHPAVAPRAGEIVVSKLRVSAFTGSGLDVILKAAAIEHLVICGITTSGAVLSTVREAADKDYRLTVLADGCADKDAEAHRVLTASIFPIQATVLQVDEWAQQ